MKNSTRRFIKWGALILELYALFVIYNLLMLPFPFNVRLAPMGIAAVVAGAFAYLSGSQCKKSAKAPRLSFRQIVSTPPVLIWALALVFPVIAVVEKIGYFLHTKEWGI